MPENKFSGNNDQSQVIKAIETRYKGYRFRSRLEARWAVFFDTLGLRWEYEPEGFELGDGLRYLPDFKVWYDGHDRANLETKVVWFEVKPDIEMITEREWEKMKRFPYARDLIVLDGAPAETTYMGLCVLCDIEIYHDGQHYRDRYGKANGKRNIRVGDYLWGPAANRRSGLAYGLTGNPEFDTYRGRWTEEHRRKLKDAVYAARSTRFEYGEAVA